MDIVKRLRHYLRLLRSCRYRSDKAAIAFSLISSFLFFTTRRRLLSLLRGSSRGNDKGRNWLCLTKHILGRPAICQSRWLDSKFYLSDFGSFIMFDYEEPLADVFKPTGGDVVLDIGAHQGRYSMLASRLVGDGGRVVALEPHPSNFETLTRNLQLNGISNVSPLQLAAHSKSSTMVLFETDSSPWHSMSSQLPIRLGARLRRKIEVTATTIDELVKELDLEKVDWVKIDVEGVEYDVLRGMASVLEKNLPRLVIEVHSAESGRLVREYLRARGYATRITGFRRIEEVPEHYYLFAERME